MSTSSSLQLDRLEEPLLLRRLGAHSITWYYGETTVGSRFDDLGDLVARGGSDGHMGRQHTLLSCSRRDGDHLQVQQLRVGTVQLHLEGAAPSRSSRPARQADAPSLNRQP